ncbi:patatin-like phospholipase family protein [Candidatus Thiothrix anitrata]|uniref:Patatin-like phospholipase family protein n=1 Tax=Candidatus Thiothrix anitrata TaxID=2823902 RepID=A0ABX7X853_9GAMM|nr:patatin-like phospholipase family protein [Candidatus Thiothrix anitrata]QTR51209.1 patatin-like phospholipase family protein [Candidatus Thiothrix anitrata]
MNSRKILSLDGGGIRGVVTIEIIARIEQLLRETTGNPHLVLADYFDFIAGTSTGAIIAAGLSIGMSVDEIRSFYLHNGREMFDHTSWPNRFMALFGHRYKGEKLAAALKAVFGEDTTLGSDKLKTLLMVVMQNAKTDSPWPVSNNPAAKYNDLATMGVHSNLHLPLWQLVRASTAAPTYFPPEKIQVEGQDFLFVDGAVTPYNNPAFQAFLMATLQAYNLNWSTGKDKLLLVSVGTGRNALNLPNLNAQAMHLLHHAATVPVHLMNAAQYQQDMLCRIFGDCRAGDTLDSEIGNLHGELGAGCVPEKLFTYVRYNFDLDAKYFAAAGLPTHNLNTLRHIDAVSHIHELRHVGKVVAEREVGIGHFAGFV